MGTSDSSDSKQYIIVCVGEEQYGIDIKYIDSIIVMQKITRVPKAQAYFMGVINLRGDIIPIMSLRHKLGLEEAIYTPITRIIILKPEAQAAPVGIIVDEVREVVTLDNADVEKMNYDENDDRANYSIGIGKFEKDLVNLLNIPALIMDKETVAS
ncbi:MAG TPA: chemotaxis protein CheW [Mobilitalea sp.]|nr:chemotaxis protein CheW [Mobilitalea sp.]